MILVAYQGKEKFAESLREQEKKAGRERTIVPRFHEWVKNCMKAEQNLEEELREKLAQEPDQIIVCDELGCGVVPMDAFERAWRERDLWNRNPHKIDNVYLYNDCGPGGRLCAGSVHRRSAWYVASHLFCWESDFIF